ncbi:N-acetylglucosamine/diacetylchitobiose ABC transporter substrate-binding protein [Streptomyces sp. NPDC018031]|uniref:N-acetylglucosamine/diacetylchitobiose ABC transporter substrate-binding protein n=1 Tax=Streptomyces sp. NPDC018031 TaxID=3365033 RepID=UPI003793832D
MKKRLAADDPRRIGPFRLFGLLGGGGMGRVYLGRSPQGRTVAVKAARAELSDDPVFRRRFAREVAAARRVVGPYVAPVVDADPDAGTPWMATAYVPGVSLTDAVTEHGPLPEPVVRLLLGGLVEALTAIHAAGLVHRDLKPSNVLLAPDGPRVIDFGIAHSATHSALTHTGTSLGTAGYMAPEQVTGSGPGVSGATDVFALGGVLVFAATGAGPYGAADPQILMYRTVHEGPLLAEVPKGLRRIAERCLAKDPAARPALPELAREFGPVGPAAYAQWLPAAVSYRLLALAGEILGAAAPDDAPEEALEGTPAEGRAESPGAGHGSGPAPQAGPGAGRVPDAPGGPGPRASGETGPPPGPAGPPASGAQAPPGSGAAPGPAFGPPPGPLPEPLPAPWTGPSAWPRPAPPDAAWDAALPPTVDGTGTGGGPAPARPSGPAPTRPLPPPGAAGDGAGWTGPGAAPVAGPGAGQVAGPGAAGPAERRIGRRGLLRGLSAAAVTAAAGGGVAWWRLASGPDDDGGGGSGGGSPRPGGSTDGENTGPGNPLGAEPGARVDVLLFRGQFVDTYLPYPGEVYRKAFDGAQVKKETTDQIGAVMTTRLSGDSPPDLVENSGPDQLTLATLAKEGRLTDLTALLDAPSYDDPDTRVRDTLRPGALETDDTGRKVLALHYSYTVYGVWHSGARLQELGLESPKTWDDMLEACRAAKSAGTAGWTYAGTFPYYLGYALLPFIGKIGGPAVLAAIDNLEPRAWRHSAVRDAFEAYYQLGRDGHVLPRTADMNHTESQQAWAAGKALFLPNGSWIAQETEEAGRPEFELAVAGSYSLSASDKLPFGAVWGAGGAPFLVPRAARNPAGAQELLRIMLSQDAAHQFGDEAVSLTSVVGTGSTDRKKSPLVAATSALDAAGKNLLRPRITEWYDTLYREGIAPVFGRLLQGEVRPADAVREIQRAADRTAGDAEVPKRRHPG